MCRGPEFMTQARRGFLVLSVIVTAAAFGRCAGDDDVQLSELARAGRATQEALETRAAFWTLAFEADGGELIGVDVDSAPPLRRWSVWINRDDEQKVMLRIVEREGVWYVTENGKRTKCRPYEAPSLLPILYTYLARSELPLFVDAEAEIKKVDGRDGDCVILRTAVPEASRKRFEEGVAKFEALKKARGVEPPAQVREGHANVVRMLEEGVEVHVNEQTGVVEQDGVLGRRVWLVDFDWWDPPNEEFDVEGMEWVDETASLLDTCRSVDDLIMITRQPLWMKGQETGESELLLMDIRSGRTRRVPFVFGIATKGCFSADRRRVYVPGHVPDEGAISIFEIDLATGAHRRLGSPDLKQGTVLSPELSPDGAYLTVIQLNQGSGLLENQVHIVEVASGRSKPIGRPLDTAGATWLPNREGLILVSRESADLDLPSVGTICRMDLWGNVTAIRKGEHPMVLGDSRRILFQDAATDAWQTCSVSGDGVRTVGDGLKDFGFPTVSPDGRYLIMMRFSDEKAPVPYAINLETGRMKALAVGGGMWSRPSWQ